MINILRPAGRRYEFPSVRVHGVRELMERSVHTDGHDGPWTRRTDGTASSFSLSVSLSLIPPESPSLACFVRSLNTLSPSTRLTLERFDRSMYTTPPTHMIHGTACLGYGCTLAIREARKMRSLALARGRRRRGSLARGIQRQTAPPHPSLACARMCWSNDSSPEHGA
jgi:hypothetical protein